MLGGASQNRGNHIFCPEPKRNRAANARMNSWNTISRFLLSITNYKVRWPPNPNRFPMPSRYLNPIAISVALFVAYLPVAAGPLVEKGAKLELISNSSTGRWSELERFAAAYSGREGETIYQYDPKSDRMDTLVPGAGRISAMSTTADCICLKMPMVAFPGRQPKR